MTPKFERITVFDLAIVETLFGGTIYYRFNSFLNFKEDRNSKLFGIVTVCHKYDYFRFVQRQSKII